MVDNRVADFLLHILIRRINQLSPEAELEPVQLSPKIWRVEVLWAKRIAITPHTKLSYKGTLQKFADFRRQIGYRELWLSKWITCYIVVFSTLASASKILGCQENKDDFRISMILKSSLRKTGPTKDGSKPISP